MRVTTPGRAGRTVDYVQDLDHVAAELRASDDPAGLLYGALIAASVLATASAHVEDFAHVAFSTLFVLGVYWLAHVYIEAQSLQVAGDRRGFPRRLAHMAVRESSVIKGGLPATAVYVLVDALGASTKNAAATAVYFSVAVLVYVGYLTARRAGRHGWASVLDAAVGGAFGVIVIVAKTLLH
jgi:hypothetical protein